MQVKTRSEDKVTFSRNDYKILFELYNEGCFTEISALSVRSIQGRVKLSQNKVRQALKVFKQVGYIKEGATIERAKTYYVTNEGLNKIKQVMGQVI